MRKKLSYRSLLQTMRRPGILAVSLAIFVSLAAAIQPPDAAYLQSFEKWKAELVDDLKQNWLPLAGLFWLKPGANTFGSANDNAVVLPSGPAHAGVFQLQGDEISVELRSGSDAKIDGKSETKAKLQTDVSGSATRIELGSLRMHVIKRGERLGIRVNDQELTLTAHSGDPKQGLSFVISDLTSKTETYPGGRFLETDAVADGKVVLDFNRAYSPPCAVTPYATCPLAPKENRLAIAIPAGEKYDRKHGHH